MRLTFRILSALLRYPDEAVQRAAPEFAAALAEDGLLSAGQRAALRPLIGALASEDLLDLQERYVALFDRGRALSLHLFEHVHGESRDRGQAMVDLRDRYEREGLEIAAKELPDYLPLFLEYLSVLPSVQAREELAQPGVIVAALARRLDERASLYAPAMQVLAELAGADGEAFEIIREDEITPDAIRKIYEPPE